MASWSRLASASNTADKRTRAGARLSVLAASVLDLGRVDVTAAASTNRSGGAVLLVLRRAAPRAAASGLEVRKTVTILFCDVVGSTALGEATDPETTRRVMARYAETMAEIVAAARRHGRAVPRRRGDGRVRRARRARGRRAPGRPGRAGRCSAASRELNEELRARWGVELACRIGINTGEVVAGDHATGETFVTGEPVNLAKRLEQAAEPGGS